MIPVYIFSGPVHSGKTTRLRDWLKNKNAAGILSPVIRNKRYLLDIDTNEKRQLELEESSISANTTIIGKYVFKNSVFEWGCKVIIDSISRSYTWLIIDEFGPLELSGKGFAPAISSIFSAEMDLRDTNILFVIREKLVSEFLNHINLTADDVNQFKFPV